MSLLEDFKSQNQKILNTNDEYLLAISGGIDSMILFDLCIKSRLKFSVVHCNFSLRNEESKRDENFVRNLAEKNNIRIFSKAFNTKTYAHKNHISIQEAARNLRYEYFQQLVDEHLFRYVFIAHNQNDSVETVFINMLRGTGIKGLRGIRKERGNILRPIIFANRKVIEDYAKTNDLSFVEDSSNAKDDYLRNNIRHHLIPSILKINENAQNLISKNLELVSKEVELNDWLMNEWLNNNIEHNENNFIVEFNSLNNIPHPSLLIRQILKPDHIDLFEIEKFIHSKTGSILETSIYKVLKNRSELVFQKKTDESTFKEEFIFEDTKHMVDFHVECFTKNSEFKIESNPNIAFFDFDSLKFPIKIRSWRNGDYFYPLGMNHKKLLSDFFINNKIPLFEKEKIKVMVSGEEICWVAGMRIDNRFAITSSTEKIFKISYLKNL